MDVLLVCTGQHYLLCCGGNKKGKLVRKANSVVGMELDSVETVTVKRMRGKWKAIMGNPSFPLYDGLRQLRRMVSHRFI